MTMTLGTALTNLRDRLNEPTEGTWSNASLRRYINEGLRECSRRSEGWRASTTEAVSANTATYTLTGIDVVRLSTQVYFQPTGETSRIPIEYQDQAALDRIWGSDMVRQTGYPSYWTTEGFDAPGGGLDIRLFPVPSVDGTLHIYYYRFATELATDSSDDGVNLDCPSGWEDTVIDWAAYRAYLAKHMTDLAQIALTEFSVHLSGLTEATIRYTDSPTQMIQDRADLSMLSGWGW